MKSYLVHFFAGAVVIVAAGAVAAVAAPDVIAPSVKKVRDWARVPTNKATLKGQLRLDGEPLAFTRIELHTAKGLFVTTTRADGLFELSGLPVGEARISVHTQEWPQTTRPVIVDDESDYSNAGAPVTLPDRFRSVATSGLTADLKAGEQWRNIFLPE